MDTLVIVPVAALLGLSFLTPGTPSLKHAAIVWLVGLLIFIAIRPMFPDRVIFSKSDSSLRVQSQTLHLRNQKDWQNKPVLILEGSSVTQFGVDGWKIEKTLAKAGIDATVLQFCLEGANHFERLYMLESFFSSLTPAERKQMKNTKVVLLSEVFDAYDENPLYLFPREAYSERAIAYLNPRNALAAWRAYAIYLNWQQSGNGAGPIPWELVEHALLNELCVGAFSEMRWPRPVRTASPAFFGLSGVKPGFRFDEAWKVFSAASEPGSFPTIPYPQWESYYKTLRARCDLPVEFFALPVLEPHRYFYQTLFATRFPVLGPPARSFWSRLDSRDDWYDGTHPQKPGAQIFTDWLSGEIIRGWPQITGHPQ